MACGKPLQCRHGNVRKAERTGLGSLSDVAVLKRLRHAEAWLGH